MARTARADRGGARTSSTCLRNSKTGIYVYPVVAPEFSNWRNEQRAWRDSAVLFDQSHHMDELIVEGPDAAKFLEAFAINSFANFDTARAKHYVPVSPDGYVIGDMIIFREEEDKFVLVGRAPTANWLKYNASLGKHDVKVTHDPRSPSRPDGKEVTRVPLPLPDPGPRRADRIFDRDQRRAGAGDQVLPRRLDQRRRPQGAAPCATAWPARPASRSGAPTPRRTRCARRSSRPRARRASTCAWSAAAPTRPTRSSSGWIPSPLPAIYSQPELKGYREWLGEDSYEANGSIGGSYVADDIRDYYLTPYELGYGIYVKFDHDFVGRAALEKMKGNAAPQEGHVRVERRGRDEGHRVGVPARRGRTRSGSTFRCRTTPRRAFDRVMHGDRLVGLSMFNGYSFNERACCRWASSTPTCRRATC